jgi:hypothetical protein
MKWTRLLAAPGLLWGLVAAPAEVVVLDAVADNTMYQEAEGAHSNGAGQHFIAGATAALELRRALLRFDPAAQIPAGASITSVTLELYMSRTGSGAAPVSLHRALADWGEGTSDAIDQEGQGVPATPGDATWLFSFYPDTLWANPGGDFVESASATTSVAYDGYYVWSGPGPVADVQSWVADPGANFGWVLVGDELNSRTAKRFDSRQNPVPEQHPKLTVQYTIPVLPGDLDCSGAVDFGDINPFVLFLSNFAGWQAAYPDCPAANGDADLNGTYPSFEDINPFVTLLTTR